MDPKVFRHRIYKESLKALSEEFFVADKANLQPIVNSFEPNTLGQQLDKMGALLILDGRLKHEMNEIALKLSMSRVINFMNGKCKEVFKKHINHHQLWTLSNESSIITAPGLTNEAKDLFKMVVTLGKDTNGTLSKKLLNMAICRMKLQLYEADEQDQQLYQVLDVMTAVLRSCIDDIGSQTHQVSELTYYRQMAHVFDIILSDTNLEQKDGEPMSTTSKEICKNNAKTFGAKYMMNGRRIDMIIGSKSVELSSNEWKKKVGPSMSLKQQSKNIRMNKAILKKWLTFPIPNDMTSSLATLSMDWLGPSGYMFSVSQYEDIFITQCFATLHYPEYLADFDQFLDTLDALYVWKHHHQAMKDILVPAINAKNRLTALEHVLSADIPPPSSSSNHFLTPNILYSPTKRRRTKSGHHNVYDSQDDLADDELPYDD